MDNWISVKDRFPKCSGPYLVCRDLGLGASTCDVIFYSASPIVKLSGFSEPHYITHW